MIVAHGKRLMATAGEPAPNPPRLMEGDDTGGYIMGSVVIVVIVMLAGWILWRRWQRGQASATAVSPQGMSPADLAHKALVHGNTCLMEGKFAEAIAAFHQARELEPKHPHIAGRLAEVERQQQAASAMALASATC